MPIRLKIDPGGEWLLPFAKKKLRDLKAEMKRLGQTFRTKWFDVSSSERVFMQSQRVGELVWLDVIRISAGGLIGFRIFFEESLSGTRPLGIKTSGGATVMPPMDHARVAYKPDRGFYGPYSQPDDLYCWAEPKRAANTGFYTGDEYVFLSGGTPKYSVFLSDVDQFMTMAVDELGAWFIDWNGISLMGATLHGVRVSDSGAVSAVSANLGDLLDDYIDPGLGVYDEASGSIVMDLGDGEHAIKTSAIVADNGRGLIYLSVATPSLIVSTASPVVESATVSYVVLRITLRNTLLRINSDATLSVVGDHQATADVDFAYITASAPFIQGSNTTLDGAEFTGSFGSQVYDGDLDRDFILFTPRDAFLSAINSSVSLSLHSGDGEFLRHTVSGEKNGTVAPGFTNIFDLVSTGGNFTPSFSLNRGDDVLFSDGLMATTVSEPADINPSNVTRAGDGWAQLVAVKDGDGKNNVIHLSDKFAGYILSDDVSTTASYTPLGDGLSVIKVGGGNTVLLVEGSAVFTYGYEITVLYVGAASSRIFYGRFTSSAPDDALVGKFVRFEIADDGVQLSMRTSPMVVPAESHNATSPEGAAETWSVVSPAAPVFVPFGTVQATAVSVSGSGGGGGPRD